MSYHDKRVLVTGATGTVGPRVVKALCETGYVVRTLSLDAPPPEQWPEGVDTRIGDVTAPDIVQSAMHDVDSVIHLAALLHIVNPPAALRSQYERINVDGTANVVEAARRAGIRRLVFFSTINVYGASNGGILTEESPLHPDSFYTQTKAAAEKIVLSAKHEDGTPLGTVLRLGTIYGARIKGNYRRLLMALARGRFIPIGSGANRRSLVYDKDVIQATLLALRHSEAAGRVFNVTDGQIHSMKTIIETICDALGRHPPRMILPIQLVRGLVGVLEDLSQFFGTCFPITRATIDKYTEDMAVDGRKFCAQTGFVPKYDLAAGWREIVDEMRRSGDI